MTRQDTERLSSDTLSLYNLLTLSLYNLLIKGVNMEGAVANEWDQYIGPMNEPIRSMGLISLSLL